MKIQPHHLKNEQTAQVKHLDLRLFGGKGNKNTYKQTQVKLKHAFEFSRFRKKNMTETTTTRWAMSPVISGVKYLHLYRIFDSIYYNDSRGPPTYNW